MIPRVSHRIWIIVSWYLLLKCSLANQDPALGTPFSKENSKSIHPNQRNESPRETFHRTLDNSPFLNSDQRDALSFKITAKRKEFPTSIPERATQHPTPVTGRHKINVAYNNLDNVLHTNDEHRMESAVFGTDLEQPKQHNLYGDTNDDRSRHWRYQRSVSTRTKAQDTKQLENYSTSSSTIANASLERNKGFSTSQHETVADISISAPAKPINGNGGSDATDAQNHSRQRTDVSPSNARRTDDTRTQAAVIDSLKASNLDQQISRNPPVVPPKLDPSESFAPLGALKSVHIGTSSRQSFPSTQPPGTTTHPHLAGDPQQRAITTPAHSSVTTDSHHYNGAAQRPVPPPGTASIILLDDSVYITPLRSHSNASSPFQPADLTLDPNGAIFGGRNFDEQIIFLNGPDLLETSVEQSEPAGSTAPGHRIMGKVARNAPDEVPLALPLRPIVRDPAVDEQLADSNVVVVYADQHETVRLNCEVDADITTGVWLKDGQMVHAMDKKSRTADIRFVRESFGALTITDVLLEDDGVWQCEAENARGFFFNGRPIKLIVLDPPKEPYLLIDSRRLDAGNMFIPVKENAELTLACVSEGGNPKPTLTWEVLLSPGIDRHAQKLSNDVLELQEIKKDKDKEPYKINSGAVSEARLPAIFRVHHNARILCIMEHPTLKVRQNASILLDVQYTPSFAITRTPGFGYPLREGIEVSLKCDVDSNPPSTPLWQKDDGDPPVPQTGDGFLNFSSIRREHSGWYKCTSRHLNFQYSSIGYYLSVRYDPVDVTSEPVEQDLSLSSSFSSSASSSSSSAGASSSPASSGASVAFGHTNGAGYPAGAGPPFPGSVPTGTNSFKAGGQMEVELGGSVTLQCPQGSLGCWSHLDSASARAKGPGSYTQTGQLSLKDVVYQDAGTYKCVGQSAAGRTKKLDLQPTATVAVKGIPKVIARNSTPAATAGAPLHLSVEFCSSPPAYAARWLHGDRIYTPGSQYGSEVIAYGFTDLPTPHCKETRLTYVHMHEKVPRTFYFVVSSPTGVAEAVFKVNYTQRHNRYGSPSRSGAGHSFSSSASSSSSSSSVSANINGGLSGYKIGTNTINTVPGNGLDDDEELMEPEEIHFPIFGTGSTVRPTPVPPFFVAALCILPLLLHWHTSWRTVFFRPHDTVILCRLGSRA